VLVVGANGAGKTNLLEALHVGTQGFSPRTRSDAQLIRFGEDAGRISLRGRVVASPVAAELTLTQHEGKRALLNGERLRTAEQLRSAVSTLVFTPDRLAIVKGGPAVRRAYVDRSLARLYPARAQLPTAYAAALAQRNAALRLATRDAIAPWTEQVARLGADLVAARLELLDVLSEPYRRRAAALGLAGCSLGYEGDPPSVEALAARLERDLERGSTGLGPHLHDVRLLAGDRDLRSYGSQGEQRIVVLALLLAEAELLAERRGAPPLLLLDDVLSELDPARRAALAEQLEPLGQTLVTATSADALPVAPAQLLEVTPGEVRIR